MANITDITNNEIKDVARKWGRQTKTQLLFKLAKLPLGEKGALYQSLKQKLKSKKGEVEAISFNFDRHGVFLEKGVGKETPIHKVGQTKRKADPWFNPTISAHIDELADELLIVYGKEISNHIFIK